VNRKRPLVLLGAAIVGCALAGETPPASAPQEKPAAAAVDSRPPGQRLYARHCLSCHQADGWGVPNMQPAIVGGTWVKGESKALALFVMTGGFDSAQRKEGAVSHNVMPPFRQLSDEDLAGILTYIRDKFGGGASAVTPAEVAEARATLPPS
jgi:mono/diheme cytochrome c family protein